MAQKKSQRHVATYKNVKCHTRVHVHACVSARVCACVRSCVCVCVRLMRKHPSQNFSYLINCVLFVYTSDFNHLCHVGLFAFVFIRR